MTLTQAFSLKYNRWLRKNPKKKHFTVMVERASKHITDISIFPHGGRFVVSSSICIYLKENVNEHPKISTFQDRTCVLFSNLS